jgi:hypothetical protein
MQNVCAAIGSIDEPMERGSIDESKQRIDFGDPGVLEPHAHIRQLELAVGFVGKAYVGHKVPTRAKPTIVYCALFASLERQIRIWVGADDDAARVFQMEHEEPTDEIAIVS